MAVTAPLRVVIADDHAPTRAAVRRALEHGGFDVCAEATDADTAVQATRDTRPVAALLDVRMKGNGIRAAEIIHHEFPAIAVVMLTVSSDEDDLFASLAVGACGYWLKGQDMSTIPPLIHRALADEAVLSDELIKHLVRDWRAHDVRIRSELELVHGYRLSSRERQVIGLLSEGLTTAEIGGRLFIAPATVRTHIASIAHKVRARDRTEILGRLRRPLRDEDGDPPVEVT
ncbi:MAG: response regulator transcription factor [Acidimicrobiales bacterium]